jgi:hypothetical protein
MCQGTEYGRLSSRVLLDLFRSRSPASLHQRWSLDLSCTRADSHNPGSGSLLFFLFRKHDRSKSCMGRLRRVGTLFAGSLDQYVYKCVNFLTIIKYDIIYRIHGNHKTRSRGQSIDRDAWCRSWNNETSGVSAPLYSPQFSWSTFTQRCGGYSHSLRKIRSWASASLTLFERGGRENKEKINAKTTSIGALDFVIINFRIRLSKLLTKP